MTNADYIRSMSDEQLRDFLDKVRVETFTDPFGKACCHKCPTIEVTVEDGHYPMTLNECDFVDGVCPYGDAIAWWLKQPAEEDDET